MPGLRDLIDLFGDIFDQLTVTDGPIYVSPPPADWDPVTEPGSGILEDPYHLISTALAKAGGGRNVYLRGGQYVEAVKAVGVNGSESNTILVKPYRHEQVTIDCFVADFLHPSDKAFWKKVDDGGEDEYVWTQSFPGGEGAQITRGAFLETHQHTRLVTYHHLEDLRADNELDPRDLPTGDNRVWRAVENTATGETELVETDEFRNWVYMGPGIWFDPDPLRRELHIRMSHTHNKVIGWPDYTGPRDPSQVRLALSTQGSHAVFLQNCNHIRFSDLEIRFGGEDTIRIRNCSDIEFDHVNIRAGSRAIRLEADDQLLPDGSEEHNADIVFQHCEIDGGTPTWFFRSDRKDEYRYVPADIPNATVAQVQTNHLGHATTSVLISSRRNASNIQIHHCKIFNGHDVCIFGERVRFHHNWVHNINDDALYMGSDALYMGSDETVTTDDARIYRNVITQCLSALSFAAKDPLGHVRIFRNLFDLRQPTLGIRPRHDGDNPMRQGQLFKSNGPEGPIDLWHNTCLTLNAGAKVVDGEAVDHNDAGFSHYANLQEGGDLAGRRRAFNNIFVAAYPVDGITKPIAFLPAGPKGPTDGNTYHRVGPPAPMVQAFIVAEDATEYFTLAAYHNEYGWEGQGWLADPTFVSYDTWAGYPFLDDDLRLRDGNVATVAIGMDDDIDSVERQAGGILALIFGHERGCYWGSWDRLHVGVDGNDVFPA
jgi:hypothetical protein